MPQKRKKTSLTTKSNKRQKRISDAELFNKDDDEVYDALAILDENKKQYLVDWAPDRKTGAIYAPEWTDKELVSPDLRADWELEKRAKGIPGPAKRVKGKPKKLSATVSKPASTGTRGESNDSLPEEHSPLLAAQVAADPENVVEEETGAEGQEESPHLVHQRRTLVRGRRRVDSSPDPAEEDYIEPPAAQSPTPPSQIEQQAIPHSAQLHEGTSHAISRRVEVQIPPLRETQKEQYHHIETLPGSPFHSSQIISGTAPQRVDDSTPQSSSQPVLVDAAAAFGLTQQHSQYQDQDTAKETNDTTGSAVASSPSSVQASAGALDTARGAIVPDSQSFEESASFRLSTQNLSNSDSSKGTTSQEAQGSEESLGPTVQNEVASQPVPESSVLRPSHLQDSTTESAAEASNDQCPFVQDDSSVDEEEHQLQAEEPTEPASPEAAVTISSTSSPPPTESADKSQQTESQSKTSSAGSASQRQPLSQDFAQDQSAVVSHGDQSNLTVSSTSQDFQTQIEQSVRPPTPPHLHAPGPRRESEDANDLDPDINYRPSIEGPSGVKWESVAKSVTSLPHLRSPFSTPLPPHRGAVSASPSLALLHGLRKSIENLHAQRAASVRRSSSVLPSAPSQYPDTFGTAPPRPQTPSDLPSTPVAQMTRESSMRSEGPESSLRERIARIRKDTKPTSTPLLRSTMGITTRSGRIASPSMDRETRSPSAVPHAEVLPMPTEEENRTSERYPTLVPEKIGEASGTSKLGLHEAGDSTTESGPSQVQHSQVEKSGALLASSSTNEHVVPIYFAAQQRDYYRQTVIYSRDFLDEFRTQLWPSSSDMFLKAVDLVKRLHQVCLHPDFNNEETFTQVQADDRNKARWDLDTSAKFRFLHALFTSISDRDIHVVINVHDSRLRDTLNTFLSGIDIQHHLATEPRPTSINDGLHVTLLPDSTNVTGLSPADLIIVLEGSLEVNVDALEPLRTRKDGSLAPLLTLVVPMSVEHIERCMLHPPTDVSRAERLSVLMETIVLNRNEAGLRTNQVLDPRGTASAVVQYLSKGEGQENAWPLHEVDDVRIQWSLFDSQTTSGDESALSAHVLGGTKRTLEDDPLEGLSAKRSRVAAEDEVVTINPQDISITHVSDSAASQSIPLHHHAAEMEVLRSEGERRDIEMQDKLQALQARLDEHVTALEDLQYRHEEQRAELVNTIAERDQAQQTAIVAATQMNNRDILLTKTRTERDEFRQQLATANAALLDHSVPERAALEALQAAALEAEKEKLKLENKNKSLTNDLDYIRALYQDISNKGSALTDENATLLLRVADLEKKASGETARAQAISKETLTKTLQRDKKRMAAMLKDREALLERKDEEIVRLKEAQRGRMGTRGSSVPPGARSPVRLSSPMRLEPPRSSGVASRAGSPARATGGVVGRASPVPGGLGKSKLGR